MTKKLEEIFDLEDSRNNKDKVEQIDEERTDKDNEEADDLIQEKLAIDKIDKALP